MSFKFNPFTGNLDIVGASYSNSDFERNTKRFLTDKFGVIILDECGFPVLEEDLDPSCPSIKPDIYKAIDDNVTTVDQTWSSDKISGLFGSIDHGSLLGLSDDDHVQYSLIDGTRAFTGTVGGIDPVAASDLATKQYVDDNAGQTTRFNVNQASHGLAAQEAIYFNGTDWLKAQANDINTLGVAVVQEVIDVDNFVVVTDGVITGLSGLAAGEWYYVSDATPGLLTLTESNIYSNPLLQATSSTEGIVLSLRAQDIGGSSQTVTRCEYDSVNLNYLYTGHADPGSSTADPVWRISRYDFSNGIMYADGNQNFDNIWDDRESLTYS
jgi:hypothetical protein